MTSPSDSKFFVNDCSCLKKEVISELFIECNECIEGSGKWQQGRACLCEYRTIRQLNCPTCAADRDRLDEMHFEFDNLVLTLSSTVKSYSSCDDDVRAIINISKRMRQCNNRLLSRTIVDTIDDGCEHNLLLEVITEDNSSDSNNETV